MQLRFWSIALVVSLTSISLSSSSTFGQIDGLTGITENDWPWWRGPQRNGIAKGDPNLVTEWSVDKNILWSVDIPGRGSGSPIVVGKSIYLATCDEASGSQSVLAIDRDSGKLLWTTVLHTQGAMRKNNKSTGASSTLACDGKQLYINFANSNQVMMTALTLSGSKVWESKLTDYQIHQGYGASPAIFENLVIGIADTKGGGAIAAFDRTNGNLVWKRERPSAPNYPSPIILKIAGKDQLIMTGCDLVTSLDPSSGKTNWEVPGATTECVTSTVTDGTHVYSSGGYPKNHMSAIKADGSGSIVWENKERVYVPSFLFQGGYLFGVLDAGMAACWKADTGEEIWKSRLGGNFSASPVLVGDRIYATNESGETFVFKADPKGFEKIATNKLGDETFATPTICGGKIFLRYAQTTDGKRQEKLVSIGK